MPPPSYETEVYTFSTTNAVLTCVRHAAKFDYLAVVVFLTGIHMRNRVTFAHPW